jgi:uracil-DNA glycosylase
MSEPGAAVDRVVLHDSWKGRLREEFERPYMGALREFLRSEKAARKVIYPRGPEIFAALDLTPFDQVRVVIIGQDPYHGPNQAHGLCFSVREGVGLPPSLLNIFKEIESDLGEPGVPGGRPGARFDRERGCLTGWARQGVLLLNAVLTVERGRAASHAGRGWEQFTDRIVQLLNDERDGLVFMLWGAYAQRKGAMVDRRRHCVLTAAHPSPMSAAGGFFGCRHFSKANRYLVEHGQPPIDWFAVE